MRGTEWVCAAVLAAMAGCGPTIPSDAVDCEHGMPRQCEAEALVWNQMFREEARPPPVEWVRGVPCRTNAAYMCVPEREALGVHWNDPEWIELAEDRTDPTRISGSAYAHELMHAHLRRKYADSDIDHKRAEWGLYENGFWQHISEINQQLESDGM